MLQESLDYRFLVRELEVQQNKLFEIYIVVDPLGETLIGSH